MSKRLGMVSAPFVLIAAASCSDEADGYLPENMSEERLPAVETINESDSDIDVGNGASGEIPTEGGGLTES